MKRDHRIACFVIEIFAPLDRDHLWIKLRATPKGLPEALGKLRTVK